MRPQARCDASGCWLARWSLKGWLADESKTVTEGDSDGWLADMKSGGGLIRLMLLTDYRGRCRANSDETGGSLLVKNIGKPHWQRYFE